MVRERSFLKFFCSVMFFILIFSGNTLANNENIPNNQMFNHISLTIAGSGTPSGSWYIIAEGVAEIIRKALPSSSVTVVPGGSDANIAMLQRGEVDIAITATDSAESAKNGWGAFLEPIPLNDIKSIARLFDSKVQFVILESLRVNSIEEIRQKRIPIKLSVGNRGSGMEKCAARLLEEYGITFKDIENWGGRIVYFGQPESIRMLGDGQLNGFITQTIAPLINLTELAMKRNFKILPIGSDVIESLVKKYNYTPSIIPQGTYPSVIEDIPTLCVANGLSVSGMLDEQIVYLVTKALVENIDNLKQIHSQIGNITSDYMNHEMVFPIHSGALKVYNEQRIK